MGLSPNKQLIMMEEFERQGCARTVDQGVLMIGPLLTPVRMWGHEIVPDADIPTRWTSAYRGSRTLGTERPTGALGESFEVPCDDETEPDGERCTGVVRFGPDDPQAQCSVCRGWRGRFAPLTARQRQRMHNAEFQAEHKVRRDWGLQQRHARKTAHNARRNNDAG